MPDGAYANVQEPFQASLHLLSPFRAGCGDCRPDRTPWSTETIIPWYAVMLVAILDCLGGQGPPLESQKSPKMVKNDPIMYRFNGKNEIEIILIHFSGF